MRTLVRGVLVLAVLCWMFPDFCPGPIDDLIALLYTAVYAIVVIGTKVKEANALLSSEPTPPSS